MEVILLGTGGPRPDPSRHGPATLVRVGEDHLLFDAGRGVVMQLVRAGVPLARLGPVFVTHHHFDHIVDLADVILTTWLQGRRADLELYGPLGTAGIVTTLVERIYDKDIEFRDTGEPAIGGWKGVRARDVEAGIVCDTDRWRVRADYVVHGHGLELSAEFRHRWVCLGYRIEAEGKVVAISGDAVSCGGLTRLARGADTLVQCCYLARTEITTPHMRQVARYTLACADTVGQIAREAGVRRLVLTHLRQKPAHVLAAMVSEIGQDYAGKIVVGEDLLRLEV